MLFSQQKMYNLKHIKMKTNIFLLALIFLTKSYSYAAFEDYFLNKTMRIDYFHTGNYEFEYYSIDEVIEEPFWGGSLINLIDTFNYGKYKFEVYDAISNKLIYSRGYSTLFAEWQNTQEAKYTSRTFNETIIFPYPKKQVKIEFYSRNKKNKWEKKFEYFIDPYNYFIVKERRHRAKVYDIYISGASNNKLDIVIIPDGYTKDELNKFYNDCNRFANYLLNTSPFKENKNLINIRAIEVISTESGADIPGKDVWKNTALNTSFYTLGTERYLMSNAYKIVRDYASNTWYDQIYILVNTNQYGGGGIYNYYSVCTSDNKLANFVFIHEFGHSFAGLADEYYTSDVSVENFYPLDVEPWEPNITTLVDFKSKWENLLSKDIPVPTPDIMLYNGQIGVFEGAGYSAKGIYRPFRDCHMKSASYGNFCPVCKNAIIRMLKFYSD